LQCEKNGQVVESASETVFEEAINPLQQRSFAEVKRNRHAGEQKATAVENIKFCRAISELVFGKEPA
jgi:hypothetical protein